MLVEINLDAPNNPAWKTLSLKIPMSRVRAAKEIAIIYDKINFIALVDGRVVDAEFPVGTLKNAINPHIVRPKAFKSIKFSANIASAKRNVITIDRGEFFNLYRPSDGASAGDVVTFARDGVFHLLYLYDRHHHGSRWGGGAHYFRHIITKDFKNWHDIGEIQGISQQWQSFGTGTMIYHKGKYISTFGFHTSRVVPQENTGRNILIEDLKKTNSFKAKTFDEIAPKVPCGSSYAYSTDGINFVPSNKIFHLAENPSVYVADDNSLFMFSAYNWNSEMWRADDIDGPWTKVEGREFPCFNTPTLNSDECPSFF